MDKLTFRYFVRGLPPLVLCGLATTGIYAVIADIAGRAIANASMVVVFPAFFAVLAWLCWRLM